MSFVSTGLARIDPRVLETRNVLRQQRGLEPLFGTAQQRFAQTRAARPGRGFRNGTRKLRGWTTNPSRLINPAAPTGEELLPGEINGNAEDAAAAAGELAAAAGQAAEAAGQAAEAAGQAAEAAGEAAEAAGEAAGAAPKGGRRRSSRRRKTRRRKNRSRR